MAHWISLEDLGKYLKKSTSTLYKLANAGKLPGHKIGRTWRFDRDDIDAWMKGRGSAKKGGRK